MKREDFFDSVFAHGKKYAVLDGAMSTRLFESGFTRPPTFACRDVPDVVEKIHRADIAAGAEIITANTFGIYSHVYDETTQMVAGAVDVALRAASDAPGCLIALDIGPTGLLLEPLGNASAAGLRDLFIQTIQAAGRADLILLETFTEIGEMEIALGAACEASNLPVLCTMSFSSAGKTVFGVDVQHMLDVVLPYKPAAIGFNCCSTGIIADLVRQVREKTDLPIVLQPNAGLPQMRGDTVVYDMPPETFAANVFEAHAGHTIFGGCCGTTAAHIGAIRAKIGT